MNNTDLKRGDVIAIDWHGKQRIAIFNEFREPSIIYPADTLHIYIELDPTVKWECLTFKCKDYDFSYDLNSITYRKATREEQRKLYDEICKYFAEEHDKEWYNHFTDSSYFDVLDFLLDELDIEDTDNIPAFVHEIQNYMWDQMCEFMEWFNNKDIHVDDEPELVKKQEFIAKVRNWLEKHTYDDKYWTPDGDDLFLNNLIGDICKYLEE